MANFGRLPVVTEAGLSRYLDEVRKFPVLEREEEYMLARAWAEREDSEAAHKLVTSHLRLVAKIAFGYRGYGLPMADLISEGNVGLMRAVRKFDPERGFRLSTYAMWWIKAAVTEYILESWSLVKLGTVAAQKKLFFSLRRIKRNLGIADEGELSPAQVQDLSKTLGLPAAEVVNMERRLGSRDISLNTPVSHDEGDSGEYQDLLADEAPDPEAVVGAFQEREHHLALLEKALATLPDREAHILRERRLSDQPMKLEDLGTHYGISRERVRQLEVRAFDRVSKFVQNAVGAETAGAEPVPA